MSKTAKYIVAIVILAGLNLFLFFSGRDVSTGSKSSLFIGEANPSDLLAIKVQNKEGAYVLAKSDEQWMIEGYKADEGFVTTLLSVIARVEINREIKDWVGVRIGKI